jgi:flagellar biosynthesis protein FliR
MHGELSVALPLLYGFALTLARISGVFAFLPIPGAGGGSPVARIVLALCCTMALSSRWPEPAEPGSAGTFAVWMLSEALLGVLTGVAVGFITEALMLGAEALSMPAGYAFASSFDPNTSADSGILLIFANLLGGTLFFTTGLDRQVIHAFADSLETLPPGTFVLRPAMTAELIKLGSSMFALAVRLALPVVALLLIVDLALGILSRLNGHIQIVSLALPVKMLVSLLVLAAMLSVIPRLFREQSLKTMHSVAEMMAQPRNP